MLLFRGFFGSHLRARIPRDALAINFPENHPARDDRETFFIRGKPHPTKGKILFDYH